MPGRLRIAIIVLLLVGARPTFAQPADQWRVAVQDAVMHPLAVSVDRKLVAARGEHAEALLHIFDPETSDVLLTVHLPDAIRAAAISPDNKWCIVSTHEHIYRIDLADGSYKTLLERATGIVAIDATGKRLAVLGDLNPILPVRYSFAQRSSQLGVYDLANGQWQKKIEIPIKVRNWITFDGKKVIAAGLGGRIGTRSGRGSYVCHVELDLSTGKHQFQRDSGGEDEFGPYTMPIMEPYIPFSPDYTVPSAIEKLRASMAAVTPRSNLDQARFTAHSSGFTGSVLAMVADNQRIAAVMDHGDAKRSLLTITSTGEISTRDAQVKSHIDVCQDRIVQRLRTQVIDIETGNDVAAIPYFYNRRSKENQWSQFIGSGWLVRDTDRLYYYMPGHDGPVWERDCPESLAKFTQIIPSPDGSRLVFGIRDGKASFCVADAATGKFLLEPKRDPDNDPSFPVSQAAFNQDGSKLLMIYSRMRREKRESLISRVRPDIDTTRVVHYRLIREYDIATGRITYERELGEREYYGSIVTTPHGWILGGDEQSLYLDEKTHAETKISFAGIDWAEAIPGRQDEALLVENRQAVITPDGKVLHTWYDDRGSIRRQRERPPTSGVALQGKVLVRRTGTSEIELLDPQTFNTIAWVHVIPLDKGFRWIAYTPDGHWDCSPEVEKHVLITHNGTKASPTEKQMRRDPSLLQSRLPR